MNTVYDLNFVRRECGVDGLPDFIDLNRLFNVSFEPANGTVKLYVLDETGSFLYKIGLSSITRQYDATTVEVNLELLQKHLGFYFNSNDIIIDTVEGHNYYLYIEDSSPRQYIELLKALCRRAGIPESRLIEVVNRINGRPVENLFECMVRRAVSGVRIPLDDGQIKLYARPFLLGGGFPLDPRATRFLARLHGCREDALTPHLRYLWVSSELLTDRLVLTTQFHQLRHRV